MKDLVIGCTVVGGIFLACLALIIFKSIAIALAKVVARSFLPAELKMLEWLQDRATARTLGIDVGVVQARRRMETLREPITIPKVH
jgi:hypothetical protein